MAVSRIAEMSETVDGSFYLVVEFRHAPTDPDPYLIEDFIIGTSSIRTQSGPALEYDEHGRVTIRGRRVWPTVEVDGELVPHPQLEQARLATPTPYAAADIIDQFDEHIARFIEGPGATMTGNRLTTPPETIARVRDAAVRSAAIGMAARGDTTVPPPDELRKRAEQRRRR